MSWRNLQAWDLTSLFALTYWPIWLISQLVSPYTSCFAFWKRQERHSRMHWLIQNYFWHMCQKSLEMTLNPRILNVIMYSRKYLLLLSQLRTCSSRITNTIDLCTILDTSARCALKEYRLIQGPHSALFTKDSSTSLAYHCIGCLQPLLQYTVLTQGVVTHLERFDSIAELETWNQK